MVGRLVKCILGCALLFVGAADCHPKPPPPGGTKSGAQHGAQRLETATRPAPTAAPVDPAIAYLRAVDAARIEADIRFIAKPRPPGSVHHAAVRERCAQRLESAGFEVFRQPFAGGENIVGTKVGNSGAAGNEKRVILSAHYDHLEGCSGADDNATGVAIVWEAARVLSVGAFEHTLILGCWDDEESGLYGSAAYAARAKQRKENVALMISLDGVGFTDDRPGSQRMPPGFARLFPEMGRQIEAFEHRANFIAAIADTSAAPGLDAIRRYAAIAKLPVLGDALGIIQRLALLDASRSDHASFWLQGFPALLLSDTANFRSPYYHCRYGDDSVDTLDLGFTARVGRAVVGAVADLLESTDPTATIAEP